MQLGPVTFGGVDGIFFRQNGLLADSLKKVPYLLYSTIVVADPPM